MPRRFQGNAKARSYSQKALQHHNTPASHVIDDNDSPLSFGQKRERPPQFGGLKPIPCDLDRALSEKTNVKDESDNQTMKLATDSDEAS